MINYFYIFFKLILRLGIINILRVIVYKAKLKFGIFKIITPSSKIDANHLFIEDYLHPVELQNELKSHYLQSSNKLLSGYHSYFFFDQKFVGNPPRWRFWDESCTNLHWTKININKIKDHDIKLSWDLSRFHWMPSFAAAYCVSKDRKYLDAINSWYADWIFHNQPNTGLNWVCAQEVSIRLINIINASYLLGINKSNVPNTLIDTIISHCDRIIPTISYGISQQNNHGISEASALYIAGNW
jgi:hypothetical protein